MEILHLFENQLRKFCDIRSKTIYNRKSNAILRFMLILYIKNIKSVSNFKSTLNVSDVRNVFYRNKAII